MGDIHPQGNPHVQLDPHNIAAVAHALTARLAQLDPAQAAFYAARGKDFDARWDAAIKRWEAKAAPLKGAPVVIMHRDQVYLCHWLGLVEVASIEPKPGVPPTAAYLGQLVGKLTTHAAEADPAQCLQRSEGRELAVRARARAGRGAAVLGGRIARSEGSLRPVRRHASTNCWRRQMNDDAHRFQHPVCRR